MPYLFTPAGSHDAAHFANMKAFRAAFGNRVLVIDGTHVNDSDGNGLGILRYVKKLPPVEQTEVVETDERRNLQDILDDIDALEGEDLSPAIDVDVERLDADAQLIEDMDGDGSDFEDGPETYTKASRGSARRAGIPMLDEDVQGRQEAGWGGEVPRARRERRTSNPTHARMSHKDCGHPITGEAGKIARAECRARRRASSEAQAS